MGAAEARGQALKELTDLVGLADALGVEVANEDTESVDRLDQAEPLQLHQRFADGTLGDAQLAGQALLA